MVTWEDASFAWEARGIEHAAEIVDLGVSDFPLYPHVALADRTSAGFATGYEVLTGSAPHRGYLDHCE